MSDNPMVMLNHAIAAAMVHGPAAGLDLLNALDADGRLAGHHRLDAVRAHLLEMAGDHQAAIRHYGIAAGPDDEPAGTELPGNSAASRRPRTARRGRIHPLLPELLLPHGEMGLERSVQFAVQTPSAK